MMINIYTRYNITMIMVDIISWNEGKKSKLNMQSHVSKRRAKPCV